MGLSQLVHRTLPEATLRFVHTKPLPKRTWRHVCRECDAEFTNVSTVPEALFCECGEIANAQVCLTCGGPGLDFDDECGGCFAKRILNGEHEYEDMVRLFGQAAVDAALAGS